MIVKRDYEVELIDRQANDEVYELVEVFNFENDTLQGIFESKAINYRDFYLDDNDNEIEFNAKIKVRIKASVSLDTPRAVNEYSYTAQAVFALRLDAKDYHL